MQLIEKTNFKLSGQKQEVYHGKVRDVYTIGEEWMLMVTTDRISAFDCILPQPIPFKGQVLNQIANHFLKATEDIIPNWVVDLPHPNVTFGRKCRPFKVEMVVRGHLCGHAWREYAAGKRSLCGVELPEGMRENDAFPEPIITPTTKAEFGHDEDISRGQILAENIVSEANYRQLEKYSLALFERGSSLAEKQGLILADTKYEFGKAGATIYLIDEIHTPDSSRYFYREGFEERQAKGLKQQQLSKEFVREFLISEGFQGKEGQKTPEMSEAFVQEVSERYIALYEKICGKKFVPTNRALTSELLEAFLRKQLEK